PRKRIANRLLARRDVASAGRQQIETLRQSFQHGARRKEPNPRSRQFDRKREAVQMSANLGDRRSILLGQRERRQRRLRALDEELNRRTPGPRHSDRARPPPNAASGLRYR